MIVYYKLDSLLEERHITKKKLGEETGLSTNIISKISKKAPTAPLWKGNGFWHTFLHQNPSSSPTSTNLIRPAGRQLRVMRIWLQMHSGLLQLPQEPVTVQGVFPQNRC